MRRPILTLAALLAVGLLAGCGSSKATTSTTTTTTTTAVTGHAAGQGSGCVTVPRRRSGARSEPKPTAALAPGKTYDVTFVTNCGTFTFRLDQAQSPNASASFVSLVAARVLQRDDLPPDRPRLRDPGRRPDRHAAAAAPATRPSTSRRRAPPTPSASSRWRRPAQQPAGTAGSQFFVVTGAERRPAARLRDHRQGDERPRRRRADRQARERDSSSRRESSRSSRRPSRSRRHGAVISAVVLAAGAATRFGSPKQLLLLPYVLERLRAAPSTRS